jgi:hypothetical protein
MAATYFITHRRMEASGTHAYKHVGSVKLLDGGILTRAQVLTYMRQGIAFYTYVPGTGHQAKVIPFNCTRCGTTYLTTEADAWKDDNLDQLPTF